MTLDLTRRRLLLGGAALTGIAVAVGAASGARAATPPSTAEIARYAEEMLAKTYRADRPGAAVLLAQGHRVLFRAARGLADVEAGVPLKPGDLFRIGSVTKQMSAAGLLKLVEMGKVSLDDPLTKFVPGYPNGDKVTVLMLLNHTSGIRSYTSLPGYMAGEPIRRDLTTAQMIEVFKDQPPEFAPGERWNYNNSGYVLVGAVIEAASGMAWHEWLDEALFKPLGMTNTGYGHESEFSRRQVKGYTEKDGKPIPMMVLSMTQPHAAGAIVSTVDDLLKWNRALHEGRVLGEATYSRMITPAGAAAAPGYGFGISNQLIRTAGALHHNGGIFGFSSTLFYVPGPDITVAVLKNDDADNPGLSNDVFAAKLAAFALGDPYPEMRAIPVDAAALKAAEGVYLFEGAVRRILRVVDGRLTAQRDQGRRTPLTPIATDDFLYEDGLNRLVLQRDGSGAITGMRFWANGDGEGVVGQRTNEPLPEAPAPVVLPRAALERVIGTYGDGGGLTLRVYIEGDLLKGVLTGQDPVTLRPISPTEFAVDEANARVLFQPGQGPAGELVIRQNGQEIELKRTP